MKYDKHLQTHCQSYVQPTGCINLIIPHITLHPLQSQNQTCNTSREWHKEHDTQKEQEKQRFLRSQSSKYTPIILNARPKLYRVKPYNIPDGAECFKQQDDIHS